MTPVLHYIYDPLCGWCYAAGPLVRAAEEEGIAIVLHGGGLWPTPTHIPADKRAYIRQADARIATLAGVTFGAAYLDGSLADPDTVLWSRPVTAAVLAAGSAVSGGDLAMLRAIQHAYYVDGLAVVEEPVLAALAGPIGIAADIFSRAIADAPVDAHIAATRRMMQRLGVGGFPAFFVERSGSLTAVRHEPFYGRPAAFVEALLAG